MILFSDVGHSQPLEKLKRYVFLLFFVSCSALMFFKGSEAYPARPR
jgi:hypothetical protein